MAVSVVIRFPSFNCASGLPIAAAFFPPNMAISMFFGAKSLPAFVKQAKVELRLNMSAFRCLLKPLYCVLVIFYGRPGPLKIHTPYVPLRLNISAFCCSLKPLRRLQVVLGTPLPPIYISPSFICAFTFPCNALSCNAVNFPDARPQSETVGPVLFCQFALMEIVVDVIRGPRSRGNDHETCGQGRNGERKT